MIVQLLKYSMVMIGVLFVTQSFSYAQNSSSQSCTTCSQSPQFLQSYRNFSEELIAIISTIQTSGRRAWAYTPPWGFQWGLFSAQSGSAITRAIAWLVNNINQKFQTLAVTTALLWSFGADFVNEWPLGFTILFRPRPFVRDYKILSDLDTLVSDKVVDLWLSAGYFKNITEVDLKKIQALLKKYEWTWPDKLFTSTSLKAGADYNALTTFLTRSSRKLKRFVVLWSWAFTDKTYDGKNLKITWNQSGLNLFSNDYQCVRGIDVCGGSFEKFAKNIKKVVDTVKNTTKGGGFIKRITDASKRLVSEYGATVKQIKEKNWKDVEYTEDELAVIARQKELLRSQYGLNSNESFYNGKKGFLQNIVRGKVDFWLDQLGLDPKAWNVARKRKPVVGEKNQSQSEAVILEESTQTLAREKIKQQFLDDIKMTIENVGTLHAASIGESSVTDPKSVTRVFMSLSDSVYDAIAIIWTERNASSNDLVNNLGVACEKQCNNLFGKCYY